MNFCACQDQQAQLKTRTDYFTWLSSECLRKVLEYFGHVARMGGNNFKKLIVTGKVDGKSPRGRSPTDQIRTTLDSLFHNALQAARDRNRWKKIVREKVIQKGGHDPQ
ncbi:uncharacterized protein LOC114251396, partial [Bombyx mandarina]|uniref:Uncharacterized protein LOC114251396 n=1 Tax=Bombyx mandarina TaxID=7092 RepID=A0A6J2KIQ1_BOMMA